MGSFFSALLDVGEIFVLWDMFKKHRGRKQKTKRPRKKNRGCLTFSLK